MPNRIVVFEVPDVQTEDFIRMAIAHWNVDCAVERRIRITNWHGLIVGGDFPDQKDLEPVRKTRNGKSL